MRGPMAGVGDCRKDDFRTGSDRIISIVRQIIAARALHRQQFKLVGVLSQKLLPIPASSPVSIALYGVNPVAERQSPTGQWQLGNSEKTPTAVLPMC